MNQNLSFYVFRINMNGIINIISTWNFENLQGLCWENLLGVGGGEIILFAFLVFIMGGGNSRNSMRRCKGVFVFYLVVGNVSLLCRGSLGLSHKQEECVTSPKNGCAGGYGNVCHKCIWYLLACSQCLIYHVSSV